MTVGRLQQTQARVERRPLVIILAVAVAWLGLWAHEFYRVPSALGLTLDGSLPLLAIALALLIWWLWSADKRPAAWALLIYALINAVGGMLSVLPLPFLPFVPEQTVDHYLVHVLYAVCQGPLLGVALAVAIARRM
jgi:cytochrome bd-type quinol oxidase subunit 2